MSRVIIYVRDNLAGPTVAQQSAAALAFYWDHLAPLGYYLWASFRDTADMGTLDLGNRPAGYRLPAHLGAGSAIVIACAHLAFRSYADLFLTLRSWREGGVRACVLDLVPSGDASDLDGLLSVTEGLLDVRCQWMREQAARKRAAGQLTGRYRPYGWKSAGRRGRRRLVPDEQERAIGRWIVQCRKANWTWEAIYWELRKQGVRSRSGREWSTWLIRKAHDAELQLQAEAHRQATSSSGNEHEPQPSA